MFSPLNICGCPHSFSYLSLISNRKRWSLYYHMNCEICTLQPEYSLLFRKLVLKSSSLITSSSLCKFFPSKTHSSPLSWRTLLYLALLTFLKTSLFLSFLSLAQFLNEWFSTIWYLLSINLQRWIISLLMALIRILSQIQCPFLCHCFPWSFWNKVFCFPPHFPYSPLPYAAFRLFSFYFFRQSSISLTGFSSSPCSLISLYTGL